jgi:hypothetical protein
VTTEPLEPGFPKVLNKGQFYEFNTKNSFIFSGDKPFMPVQYLEGQDGGAGTGDPASYQMVPTEQFLDRYVFVTGIGYNPNYVQVVRPAGACRREGRRGHGQRLLRGRRVRGRGLEDQRGQPPRRER